MVMVITMMMMMVMMMTLPGREREQEQDRLHLVVDEGLASLQNPTRVLEKDPACEDCNQFVFPFDQYFTSVTFEEVDNCKEPPLRRIVGWSLCHRTDQSDRRTDQRGRSRTDHRTDPEHCSCYHRWW